MPRELTPARAGKTGPELVAMLPGASRPNTLAWARHWVLNGAPVDLSEPPYDREHHVIAEALLPFRKAYLASDWAAQATVREALRGPAAAR